jgi:hypothetical protein
MKVHAKVWRGYEPSILIVPVVELTFATDGSSLERAIHPGPTWLPGPTALDLSEDMLTIAGGRKSIARYLMQGAGLRPLLRGVKPQLGVLRRTGLFHKNKTCIVLTGRGDLAPPAIRHFEYQLLSPLLRAGLSNWAGEDVNCEFQPKHLSAALAHLWGININKVLGNENELD